MALALTFWQTAGIVLGLPGEVDYSFSPSVANGDIYAVAVQPDGKILIGGAFTAVSGYGRNRIARLNVDGSVDTGFDPGADSTVNSLSVQDDGRIIVGCANAIVAGAPSRSSIVRVNANGTLDNGFGYNASSGQEVYGATLLPDSKVLAWGKFSNVVVSAGPTTTTYRNLARYNAGGTYDHSFTGSFDRTAVYSLLPLNGNTLLAAASTGSPGVLSITADGVSTGFYAGEYHDIYAMAVQNDGKVLLGGQARLSTDSLSYLVRRNVDGSPDSTFLPGLNGPVHSLAVQADGRMVVVGQMQFVDGFLRNRIARLAASGALDYEFLSDGLPSGAVPGANINSDVFGTAIQADGQVLVVGNFSKINGITRSRIARLQNYAATQSLSVGGAGYIEWQRGGSAPQAHQVTFELSTDGGTLFTPLGSASRMASGWELSGLALPESGHIRARARVSGGRYNGSHGLIETVSAYSPGPEIQIKVDGATITSGSTIHFGDVLRGVQTPVRTVTVTNVGNRDLSLTGFTAQGAQLAEFTHSQPDLGTLVPGASTSFTVSFLPQMLAGRNASLHLASNDSDEATFDMLLFGNGTNHAPTISDIDDITIHEDAVAGPIAITVGDADTAIHELYVVCDSSNPALVSNAGLTVSGTGASRTFTLAPAHNQYGTANVTVWVSDGIESSGSTFQLTVLEEPDFVEIELLDESAATVSPGGFFNFGNIGAGSGVKHLTYTIKNLGTEASSLSCSLTGNSAGAFSLPVLPPSVLNRGQTATFKVQASSATSGLKTAVLHIITSDPDESDIDITLIATGVAATPPLATTLPAAAITFNSAALHGTVNARGVSRDVIFEYGTTTAYGSIVTATPGTATGTATAPFGTVLTGLQPHTKYHYRIRASAGAGSANGKNFTFSTATRNPVATADAFLALPSGKVALPVLANDTDADGDALTVYSFTPVTPAAAGKLAKVGADLVFTPSASYAGGASFTYITSDAFGGRSAPASVTLGLGSCSVPSAVTIPSDSPPYEVTVTANAPWVVVESLSWLSVDPARPAGNVVRFIPAPNPSVNPRSGTIAIGGKPHIVTQSGIAAMPQLTRPGFVPQAALSAAYNLAIPTQYGPVRYTVTGLPKGLTLSNTTGQITGMPTVAGTATVVILATNAMGTSNPISFDLTVLPFPSALLGGYTASIERDPDVTESMGGLLTMNVTGVGTVTGTLKVGGGSHSFNSRLNTAPDPQAPDPDHATLTVTVPRTGKPSLWLFLTMNTDLPGHITGQVNSIGPGGVNGAAVARLNGTRNVWHNVNNPAVGLDGTYHVSLQPLAGPDEPRGLGFLTIKMTLGGIATWSGQLPDGTILNPTTTTLASTGSLPLFLSLYGGKGSLSQTLRCYQADSNRFMEGTLAWCKKPQPAVRAYPDGFSTDGSSIPILCRGATYTPPAAGKTLLNRTAPATVSISFANGGIESVSQFSMLDQNFQVSTQHKASFSTSTLINPAKVGLTKLDVANGTFSGSLTLSDPNPFNSALPQITRTVNFSGLIISGAPSGTDYPMGVGYFLLPAIAGPPANIKTSRQTSVHVLLQ